MRKKKNGGKASPSQDPTAEALKENLQEEGNFKKPVP